MPRADRYQPTGITRTPKPSPADYAQVPLAIARAGAGVSQVAEQAFSAIEAIESAQRLVKVERIQAQIDEFFKKKFEGLRDRTDHDNFGKYDEETLTEAESMFGEAVGDDERLRRALETYYKRRSDAFSRSVRSKTAEEVTKEGRGQTTRDVQQSQIDYANADTPEKRKQIRDLLEIKLRARQVTGILSQNEVEKILIDFDINAEIARIEQDIRVDATQALKDLNAGKYKLDPKTKEAKIQEAEAEIKKVDLERDTARAYSELYEKHKGDPDAALEYLKTPEAIKKYGLKAVENAKTMFRGLRADQSAQEAEIKRAEAEAREETNKEFVKRFTEKALTSEDVLTSNLTASDQKIWIANIQAQADDLAAGKRSRFKIIDPAVYGRWSQQISNIPETVDAGEVWQAHGYGLSTDATLALINRLNAWKTGVKTAEKLDPVMADLHKESAKRIARALTNKVLDEESAGRLHLKWDTYIEKIRSGEIKTTPAEALKYFEEMMVEPKGKGIRDYIKQVGETIIRYDPLLLTPLRPLLTIDEKIDKALEEATGARKEAIQALKDGGYDATEENIQEAMRQLEARE